MKKWILLLSVLALFACDDEHDKSESILQAEAVHEQMILEYSSLKVELPEKTTFIGEMLRQAREKLDSSIVVDLENKFEGLEALSGRLLVWKAELIEIPGHAHVHEDGEECTHDHAKDALLEGMSDEDILKIQQDQQSELLGIREDLIALDLPV